MESAMTNQQPLDNQIKKTYSKRANRFFFEVVAIQIVAYIIAVLIIFEMGREGLILLALLSIGVSYLVVYLLFRHVDTLILTRLTHLEKGLLTYSSDNEMVGGEKSDK